MIHESDCNCAECDEQDMRSPETKREEAQAEPESPGEFAGRLLDELLQARAAIRLAQPYVANGASSTVSADWHALPAVQAALGEKG